jgi:hypothetical protein
MAVPINGVELIENSRPSKSIEHGSLLGDRTKENCLFGAVALLLLASFAALVVYVPVVSLVIGLMMLLGLMLMFMFGFYIGVNVRVQRHPRQGQPRMLLRRRRSGGRELEDAGRVH